MAVMCGTCSKLGAHRKSTNLEGGSGVNRVGENDTVGMLVLGQITIGEQGGGCRASPESGVVSLPNLRIVLCRIRRSVPLQTFTTRSPVSV